MRRLFLIPLVAAACSGGGGESQLLTGQFVDAPVEGLFYETATESGQTDANGEFRYRSGQSVRFLVGDIVIGEAPGAATITPFDLAGVAPPATSVEVYRLWRQFAITPIDVVANIAVFLQAIDDDGDPSNGIRVPPEVHNLATGMSLDFHRKAAENERERLFTDQFAFRKLLADGGAAGLWGGSRTACNPAYAMDALYQGLGLTLQMQAEDMTDLDNDADGAVDEVDSRTYDAMGHLLTFESMSSAGAVLFRYTYAYDAKGNLIEAEEDDNGNGIVDQRTTYDANGNATEREWDFDGDGVVDQRVVYTYDSYGSLVKEENDTNADGTVDQLTTHTYDANGNLTVSDYDSNADGVLDGRANYAYDANGNRILREQVDPANGTVYDRDIYAYDANGFQTLWEQDYNADGIVDWRDRTTYDANGNVLTRETDLHADGTEVSRLTVVYNANGDLLTSESEINGVVDQHQTNVYDANGNLTRIEVDNTGDGTTDFVTHYFYDSNGDLVMEETDYGADGTTDFRFVQTYMPVDRWTPVLGRPFGP